MVVQVYSLELEPDGVWLSVLPKAGLQRAADKLLGANMHNSGSKGRVPISYLPFNANEPWLLSAPVLTI